MARNMKSKIVVITGGATGIGFEIAKKVLENGAKVVTILDVDVEAGENAVKLLLEEHGINKASFIKCNVITDLENVYSKLIKKYRGIDVLINNAGVLNEKSLKSTIDINFTAVVQWSLKFYEHMNVENEGNGGTIINIASIYGFRVDQYLPVYQASKFAVIGFTKSLGHKYNYERSQVRVTALCPGYTETKMTSHIKLNKDDQTQLDYFVFLKGQAWQKAEVVGEAAVSVFKKGDSGTIWIIEGGTLSDNVP